MEALIKNPAQMDPMMPPDGQRQIEDLAFELVSKASSLAGRMSPIVTSAVGELVRLLVGHRIGANPGGRHAEAVERDDVSGLRRRSALVAASSRDNGVLQPLPSILAEQFQPR